MDIIALASIGLIVLGLVALMVSAVKAKRAKRLEKLNFSEKEKASINFYGLSEFLNKVFSTNQKDVDDKFIAAGFYELKFSKYFILLKYTAVIGGILAVGILGTVWRLQPSTFIAVEALWIMISLMGPDYYLTFKANSVRKDISNKLPYMLDLMGVCVQTGMTIEAAISYLSHEFKAFDKDLSYILNLVNDRSKVVGIEQALNELYKRFPSNEIRSFVMTLNQSIQYGSSIYPVLITLATDIREVQLLHVEEKIGQLSAKMSIPLILFIMIPIVVLIAAPGVMRMLS